MKPTEQDPRRAIRRLNLLGLSLIILLVGGAGGWAAISRMAGAVIAPGTIVVEIKRQESAAPDRWRRGRDPRARR